MNRGQWDGRWLVGVCVAVCLASLAAIPSVPGIAHVWNLCGIGLPRHTFIDLRTVIAGGESLRDGLDPIRQNPHAPDGLLANYPHLWFYLSSALGLHQDKTLILGGACVLAFFGSALCFAGPLRPWEGVVWAAFLCAPPVASAVVLSNNDVIIFILLALALVIHRRMTPAASAASYSLIGLCAALKFFPVCAFCLALRASRPRMTLAILATAGTGFAAYMWLIREQVREIMVTIPQSDYFMYGRQILFRVYNAAHPDVLSPADASARLVVAVVLAAGLLWWRAPRLPVLPVAKLEGLMVGSSIYLASFVLQLNGNYRLIFLLFTLPALLELSRGDGAGSRFHQVTALLTLALIGATWTVSFQGHLYFLLSKELALWVIFGLMTFLWLQCLPPWTWRLPRADSERVVLAAA